MTTLIKMKHKQQDMIKRSCIMVSLLMFTLLTLSACGDAELDARKELVALGFPFDEANFTKAVSKGDSKIIELFLEAGIGKNKDAISYGLIPAIKKDKQEMVKLLLDNGADVNVQSTDKHFFEGGTPLTLALALEKMDMVKHLLDNGADPNVECKEASSNRRDKRGGTPLIYAVALQEFDMVELLLEKGANPNLESRTGPTKGYTPLKLAIELGFAGVEELLKANGAK